MYFKIIFDVMLNTVMKHIYNIK